MNDFKPTKSQQQAIDTRGRSVLVSAAAGSGKTRVLTQRLIKAVEDGADIDSFLVITFTKAAAAELKGRIVGEIAERIAQEPDNRRLRRQSALCAKAQIGTIDSFCQTFLRENCHAAQLAPEFKVIEEDRAEAIKTRVIERVLDACYENPTEDFRLLADTVGAGRDDSRLAKTVLDIHRKTQSHARPEKWLREQLEEMQREVSDVAQTPWGREILDGVESSAEYWAQRMDELCILAGQHPQIAEKYLASLEDTALSLRDLARACKNGWDSARQFLPVSFPALGRLVNSPSPETSEYIKQVRKLCKAAADKFPKTLSDSSERLLEQLHAGIPAMRELVELTVRFDRQYSAEKRRKAEVDFADLEHLTAQLLTNEDSSPTALAREMSATGSIPTASAAGLPMSAWSFSRSSSPFCRASRSRSPRAMPSAQLRARFCALHLQRWAAFLCSVLCVALACRLPRCFSRVKSSQTSAFSRPHRSEISYFSPYS